MTRTKRAESSRWLTATAAAGGAVAGVFARTRVLNTGSTTLEITDAMPGDDLVVDADLVATRSITIHCRPEIVWPWIAQLGQGRGGFYSYDVLENLFGADIHNAGQIVPEWQSVNVGDEIRIAPQVPLQVAEMVPGRALVLLGSASVGGAPVPFAFSWSFAAIDGDDGTTRLVVRERYGYLRWWAPFLVEPVEVVSCIMSRKMLRGIRDRAERSSGREQPGLTGVVHAKPSPRRCRVASSIAQGARSE